MSNISFKQIKSSLNPLWFKSTMSQSFSYFIYDVVAIFITSYLLYLAVDREHYIASFFLTIFQGNLFFALFVIGHDCGHGSFSKKKSLNNVVGFISHHVLLVPYWAWKKSHGKHHRHTGNLDHDESFVPFNRSSVEGKNTLIRRLLSLFFLLSGLSFPLYLIFNERNKASHYWPNTAFLSKSDHTWVAIGTSLNACILLAVIYCAFAAPLFTLLLYIVPVFISYHLLLLVTLLQHHHHEDSQWYYNQHWQRLKGVLNTFDYRYGRINRIMRFMHHDIAHYHVIHHLFSTIPHYHLKHATEEWVEKFDIDYKPKAFSYSEYVKVIWLSNFVEDFDEKVLMNKLKPYEKL